MICEICNKKLNDWHGLSVHLTNQHKDISHEEYYIRYINQNKCTCLTCGKQVPFLNLRLGYKLHCNTKCARNDNKIKNKIENTMLKRHGVKSYTSSKEFKTQAENTKLLKYGDKNYNNREKFIETSVKNYNGVGFSSQSIKEKFNNTMIKTYGVNYAMESNIIKKTHENNFMDKYGVRNPLQCKEIRDKTKKKYFYDGINFDSSWEIAFYIYLSDHHIRFEYHPKLFEYYYPYDGKMHEYEVDFKLFNNTYIEIKNESLLENMINNLTDKEHYKYLCMIENGVNIITDCTKYLNYINDNYGKNYINLYRIYKNV